MAVLTRVSAVWWAAGAALAALTACAATPRGAADAGLATARERSQLGATVFERSCSGCHGKRGEGLGRVPSVIGAGALPVYQAPEAFTPVFSSPTPTQPQSMQQPPGQSERGALRTAEDLQAFVAKHMPRMKAGSLPPEEDWAVVNFILLAHGSAVPSGGVNPQNAKQVLIEPR